MLDFLPVLNRHAYKKRLFSSSFCCSDQAACVYDLFTYRSYTQERAEMDSLILNREWAGGEAYWSKSYPGMNFIAGPNCGNCYKHIYTIAHSDFGIKPMS